ncbi:MAG: DUF2946 domain-containing protein [Polaromonas sp.]|jgi:hypothetical protein|nr:DUF2946 domain-containing protein [Polaromonas sp.]
MQTLRNAHLIARFVLVWFALSVGVAVASPLVKPQAMELICSSAGVMKVLFTTEDGGRDAASPALDCPLCAATSAPPPLARIAAEPAQLLAYVLPSIPADPLAAFPAAPPPARGPPAIS